MQGAGDRPCAVHRGGRDPVDDRADVMPRHLSLPQRMLQHRPGGFPLVSPGFRVGQPGRDLLIDGRVQGLPDGGGPQLEQVPGSPGPVLRLADVSRSG